MSDRTRRVWGWGLVIILSAGTTWAAPALQHAQVLTQPNGVSFEAQRGGDEWFNWWSKEGLVIERQADEYWVYTAATKSTGAAGVARVGIDAPPAQALTVEAYAAQRPARPAGAPRLGVQTAPVVRTPNPTEPVLVLLVQFSNRQLTNAESVFQNLFFGTTGRTLYTYYNEVSHGTFHFTAAAESYQTNNGFVKVTLNYSHPDTRDYVDERNLQIVKDALIAADQYVDYHAFDTNGDGGLSANELHVVTIIAGYEESASCGTYPSVWGHRWALEAPVLAPQLDGVKICDPAFGGGYTQEGEIQCDHAMTVGIICHELGHDIGLPDLYDTDTKNGDSAGVGDFCLMSSGSWGMASGQAYAGMCPTHMCAWSKAELGFVVPVVVSANGAFTLTQSGAAAYNAIRINTQDSAQYFLVENRQLNGFDSGLYYAFSTTSGGATGGGLAIWHIDTTKTDTYNNDVNADENHKGVDLEEANMAEAGRSELDGQLNYGNREHLWYQGNQTTFNNTSNPNSKLYNYATTNVEVTGISASGASMSCQVHLNTGPTDTPAPTTPPPTGSITPLLPGTPTPVNVTQVTINLPNLASGARVLRLNYIPPGTYQMGSPPSERGRYDDEGPLHTVTIGYGFYMGETEVTQAQWKAVTGSLPDLGLGEGNDYPAYNVTWVMITQTNGFLAKLNALGQGTFRLPSESEWEYACRAGTSTRFSFGDALECDDECDACPLADGYLWWCNNYPDVGSSVVGLKWPNPWGLYDIHGNMWEWCQDSWHEGYTGVPADGRAYENAVVVERVLRGGGWADSLYGQRSAYRNYMEAVQPWYTAGLRLVMVANGAPPTPTVSNATATRTPTLGPGQPTNTPAPTNTSAPATMTPTRTATVAATPSPLIIDDQDAGFTKSGFTGSQTYENTEAGASYRNHFWYCKNEANTTQWWGKWTPPSLAPGSYEVKVNVPSRKSDTCGAKYEVHHNGQVSTVPLCQNNYFNDAWPSLGVFVFAGGGNEYVFLGDGTGESAYTKYVAWDAVAFYPVAVTTPTAAPASPTPTKTNTPTVFIPTPTRTATAAGGTPTATRTAVVTVATVTATRTPTGAGCRLRLEPSSGTFAPGSHQSLKIRIQPNGLAAAYLSVFVSFDPARLTFEQGSTNTTVFNNSIVTSQPTQQEPGVISFAAMANQALTNADEEVATLTFTCGATLGPITVSFLEQPPKRTEVGDLAMAVLPFTLGNGNYTIGVTKGLGDANEDCFVNGDDFRCVRDHFGAATCGLGDANGDCFVNGDDFRIVRDNFGRAYTGCQ